MRCASSRHDPGAVRRPFHPDPGAVAHGRGGGITVFGTSARYLAAMEKSEFRPWSESTWDGAKIPGSTSSPPLPAASCERIYRTSRPMCRSPRSPVVRTSCPASARLSAAARVSRRDPMSRSGACVDLDASTLRGEPGELVCTAPFPSMPIGFERWRRPAVSCGLFRTLPGCVASRRPRPDHRARRPGDPQGRMRCSNPRGAHRHGRVVLGAGRHAGNHRTTRQRFGGDVFIVLSVQLAPAITLDESLPTHPRVASAAPRHRATFRPGLAAPDLPRTRSGKASELAVRASSKTSRCETARRSRIPNHSTTSAISPNFRHEYVEYHSGRIAARLSFR